MSEEQRQDFERYLKELKWVIGLGWSLLAGAFGLGIWVATLEIRQSTFTDKMLEHEIALKNHGTEINGIHVKQAVSGSDLAYIKAAVERIEKKIQP